MNRAQSTMKRLKYPALDRIEVVSSSSSSQRRLDLRALVQELSMIDSDVLVAATPSPKLDLKIERMILSEAEASVINRSRDLNEERERQQKLVKEHLRRVEEQRREDQLREQMRREQEQREMENIQTSQPVTDALVDGEEEDEDVPVFDFTMVNSSQATVPADAASPISQTAEGMRGGGTPPPPPPPPPPLDFYCLYLPLQSFFVS